MIHWFFFIRVWMWNLERFNLLISKHNVTFSLWLSCINLTKFWLQHLVDWMFFSTETKSYLVSVCPAVQQPCCPCADCTDCIWQLDPVDYQKNGKSQQGGWAENRKHTEQGKKRERTVVWGMEEQAKGKFSKTTVRKKENKGHEKHNYKTE